MSIDINPQILSDQLKAEGNEFFKSRCLTENLCVDQDYQKACEKYTEAISIFPTAILYCKNWPMIVNVKQIVPFVTSS